MCNTHSQVIHVSEALKTIARRRSINAFYDVVISNDPIPLTTDNACSSPGFVATNDTLFILVEYKKKAPQRVPSFIGCCLVSLVSEA